MSRDQNGKRNLEKKAIESTTVYGELKLRYLFIMLGLTIILIVSFLVSKQLLKNKPAASIPLKDTPTPIFSNQEISQFLSNAKSSSPRVIEQQPAAGQELSVTGSIKVVFNQAMDPTSTMDAWKMTDKNGKYVSGQFTWDDQQTFSFVPDQSLDHGQKYTITIGVQAKDAQGSTLSQEYRSELTTSGDLLVSQVFPANGAVDVANNSVITVLFNRPVVALSIAEEQNNLPDPLIISPTVAGTGEWMNTSVYIFHPQKYLKGGQNYSISVKAGLQDATETSSLQKDYNWNFWTVPATIASINLSNGVQNPPSGYQNVLLDEYFAVNFHQPMEQTATDSAITLDKVGGEAIPLIKAWNEEMTQVVITPTHRLDLNAEYLFSVNQDASAQEGGNLKEGLSWVFYTVPSPALQYTRPANGTSQKSFASDLTIKFVSPMNFESVKQRIMITPSPEKEIQWWYNDWDWSVHAYDLQPSTAYTIKLLPGMQDIYGNAIQQEQTIQFRTAAAAPRVYLQMPYTPALIRNNGEAPRQFFSAYRNIRTATIFLYKIDVKKFISFQTGQLSQWEYQPPQSDLVWQFQDRNPGKLNQLYLQKIQLDSGLTPGFYFLGIKSPEVPTTSPFNDSRIVIVANTNITFKSTSTEALLWLTDLQSGKPIEDINLTVFNNQFEAIGSAKTDHYGLSYIKIPAPDDPYAIRYVMSQDEQVFAFSFSQWGSGASFYDYGSWGMYYAPPDQAKAYIYTDRPIYRPGQPVYFKGIVRIDNDLNYTISQNKQIKVTIKSYDATISEQTLSMSDFGSFSGDLLLDKEASLGTYTISANFLDSDQIIGDISFNVAEYRKPEFYLDVTLSSKDILVGSSFQASLKAEYYTGGSVGGAKVNWTLTSNPYTFWAKGDLSAFSFTDLQDDVNYTGIPEPPTSEVIADGQGILDSNGQLTVTLPAELKDLTSDRAFVFEATVTDISGNAVSNRDQILVHQSLVYVGVRAKTYLGKTGESEAFEIITVDWDGNTLSDQITDVTIFDRRWHSVQEQDAQGNIHWTSSVEEIPVATFTQLKTDENGKAMVEYIPPNGGTYKAKAVTLDKNGNQSSASAYMWVSGKSFVPWRQTDDRSFPLVSDRSSYLPGDIAEILIASPFQGDTYALITVERGHIKNYEVVLLTSNSTIYKLPIMQDMAPNIYVSVVVMKGIDETNPRPDFKIGVTELKVDTGEQAISVTVIPDHKRVQPGEKVTYQIITRDSQNNPVDAEVSFGLSDLATLSLVNPNSAPILDYFYAERSLSVWTSIPIILSLEDYNATVTEALAQGQGMGAGGGKGGGELGVIDVREEFPDTAYWNAFVETGDSGEAQVTITLPDNLTTWRADVRAVSKNTLVGQSTQDIVSSKDLLLRPQTPRFFVSGDEVQIGTAVQNNTSESLEVSVSLSAEGITLLDESSQKVTLPSKGQAYVSWKARVDPNIERADLIFKANGGGYSDATRPTNGSLEGQGIPIYRYEARESVGTSGVIRDSGTRIEAVSMPSTVNYSGGSLDIEVAPSLAAGITNGLTYLQQYPYECIEQTISKFLPNIFTSQALKVAGVSDASLEKNLAAQVETALQKLNNWQNADGGWGWWSRQKSDLNTSAYVVWGLIEAKDVGYNVNEDVLYKGVNYLRGQIKPVSTLSYPYTLNRQVFVLYVLNKAGKPDVSILGALFEKRLDMSLYARAMLTEIISSINPEDPRIKTLLSDLNNAAILSATGTHWEEADNDYWNWNTDTRTTAIILSVVSRIDPENPLVANSVRWLMSNRVNGHWQGTQETAWTLIGLSNWMANSGELSPDYKYAVTVNEQVVGEGLATIQTRTQSKDLKVDITDLLKNQINKLGFVKTTGEGVLYYSAHLNLDLAIQDVEPLNNGMIVSRNYYPLTNLQMPVQKAKKGDVLLARLTIIAPNDLHFVVIDDALPAGLEAVDQSLLTSEQEGIPISLGWEDIQRKGWGWWYFDHVELRDEKVVLSVDYLPAGTYIYTYLVRAVTPGTFQTIPPIGQEFYFPEVYGRGAGSIFAVSP